MKASRTNRRRLRGFRLTLILVVWAIFAESTIAQLTTAPAGSLVRGPVKISLDEAIQMALQHNHNLLAARTTIQQSEAEEVTANLRPNPSLFADWDYLPLNPSNQNWTYLRESTEVDVGLTYLIERGKKRQHRHKPDLW
jgi:outer membrane protein, heavy metal efflux system